MRIYSVAFFGHRYVDNIIKVENLLEEQIRRLIDENEYVDFLVGRNGDFDQCVSSSVLRVRKNHRDDNSALVLVLPYPMAEYLNNENYYEKCDKSISFNVNLFGCFFYQRVYYFEWQVVLFHYLLCYGIDAVAKIAGKHRGQMQISSLLAIKAVYRWRYS